MVQLPAPKGAWIGLYTSIIGDSMRKVGFFASEFVDLRTGKTKLINSGKKLLKDITANRLWYYSISETLKSLTKSDVNITYFVRDQTTAAKLNEAINGQVGINAGWQFADLALEISNALKGNSIEFVVISRKKDTPRYSELEAKTEKFAAEKRAFAL
jgi:hypothetical protein